MNVFVVGTEDGASTEPYTPRARDHYAFGAVGLGVAVLSVFLTYSVLVGIASLVPLLSTTVVTFAGIAAWVVVWIALDVAHDRYVRRRRAAAE